MAAMSASRAMTTRMIAATADVRGKRSNPGARGNPGAFFSAGRKNAYTMRMLQVFLNGELREVDIGTTVHALLDRTGYANRRIAVEINREIVPRSAQAGRMLEEGDRIEIVHALGGG